MPTKSEYEAEEGGTVVVTLRAYLDRVSAIERGRPEAQRRRVPSMEELAKEVGVHPVTLSNIAGSNIQHLNLKTAGRIIWVLRKHGFQIQVSDFLDYVAPEQEE
jgi:DNA-binding Xre family transcriptional regulator